MPILKLGLLLTVFSVNLAVVGQQPNPPVGVRQTEKAQQEAYLFAHLTNQNYGRLSYSLSPDGLHGFSLNGY